MRLYRETVKNELLAKLDSRIVDCLKDVQIGIIISRQGRESTALVNYIKLYVNLEEEDTQSDIAARLAEIFSPILRRLEIQAKKKQERECDAPDGELGAEDLSIFNKAKISARGELADMEPSSKAGSKKSRAKKKKSRAIAQQDAMLEEEIELLTGKFLAVLGSCFSLDSCNSKVGNSFDKLPYSTKFGLFDEAKSDFDDAGIPLSQLSGLRNRIRVIYRLLQVDLTSFIERSQGGFDVDDFAINVNTRIVLLTCTAIEQGSVTARNIKDWLDDVGFNCNFKEQQYQIIALTLLKFKKVTLDNFSSWHQGILLSKNQEEHRLVGHFIEVGANIGVINLDNFDSWYDVLKLGGCKSSDIFSAIISSFKLSGQFVLHDVIRWGSIFALKRDMDPYAITRLWLEHYYPDSKGEYPPHMSLQDTLILIVLNQIKTQRYFSQMTEVLHISKYQDNIRDILLRYMKDNVVTLVNIAEKLAEFPKVLYASKAAFDNIDLTFKSRVIPDDAHIGLAKILVGMNLGSQEVILDYLFLSHIIGGAKDIDANYESIKYFTKLLQALIAACKDKSGDDLVIYKAKLCKAAHGGIGQNIITLANASKWLDLVKSSALDFEFYSELYYSIAYGLVDNRSNIEVTDLQLWQDLLRHKLYSIRDIRDQLQFYTQLDRKLPGEEEVMVKKKHFFASGLSCSNSFTQTVVNMVWQKVDSEVGAYSKRLIEVIGVIIKEPNLKLYLLPVRLNQMIKYLEIDKLAGKQRESNRSEGASNKVSEFLEGKVKLAMPKDLDFIGSLDIELLRQVIVNQLLKLDAYEDKSNAFFQLLLRQSFLFKAFDLCKVNIDKFKLEINSLMIRYAFEKNIIELSRPSIIDSSQQARVSHNTLLDHLFRFSSAEENFPLHNILTWIDFLKDAIPTQYAMSQISSISPGESDQDLSTYYLLNSCLKSMHLVKEVREGKIEKKLPVDTLEEFKFVVIKYYISAEQLQCFSKLSEDLSYTLVRKIWANEDLTQENMPDKYAQAMLGLIGHAQGMECHAL
ncbi:MAG: hypothetical protein HON23_05755 [Rickettsiales bacterium]|nr:hypothetical protein [Rickettsiales bacterium]